MHFANLMMALEEGAGQAVTNFPITSDMLSGVSTTFGQAVTVAAPVGIGIMTVILGINFVPKLIKKLAKG